MDDPQSPWPKPPNPHRRLSVFWLFAGAVAILIALLIWRFPFAMEEQGAWAHLPLPALLYRNRRFVLLSGSWASGGFSILAAPRAIGCCGRSVQVFDRAAHRVFAL